LDALTSFENLKRFDFKKNGNADEKQQVFDKEFFDKYIEENMNNYKSMNMKRALVYGNDIFDDKILET